MPFFGLGLHVFFALLCAIHAVRTGQQMYWLMILFAFPFLGSVVYFFAVYLPNSRFERGAMRAVSAAAKAIDPTRAVREARAAFEEVPTAQNQMHLAEALLDSGNAKESATHYESCLQGLFASDPVIRFGAARAFVECERYENALRYLEALRSEKPEYRPESISILLARTYAGLSRISDASREYQSAVAKFGTYAAKAEYAIWCLAGGDTKTAQQIDTELEKVSSRWNVQTRDINSVIYRRYQAAKEAASKQAI